MNLDADSRSCNALSAAEDLSSSLVTLEKAALAARASEYFSSRGREFPWRSEDDLFKLAIAEILLQKTRASSALPIYQTLVCRYGSPHELAAAVEADLARILRPIGLSLKRAHQLRGMANALVSHGLGIFDDWRRVIAEVPGIGAYGARAIACFGLGARIGIVDANVARILRRVYCIPSTDPRSPVYQRIADTISAVAVNPRATNYGLLDIAAEICLPTPRCAECPFNSLCARFDVPEKRLM
jgi:A/G-specific adenine glycosylase